MLDFKEKLHSLKLSSKSYIGARKHPKKGTKGHKAFREGFIFNDGVGGYLDEKSLVPGHPQKHTNLWTFNVSQNKNGDSVKLQAKSCQSLFEPASDRWWYLPYVHDLWSTIFAPGTRTKWAVLRRYLRRSLRKFFIHERGLNQMGSWKHNETLSKTENIRFTWDEQVYLAILIKFIYSYGKFVS